MEHLLSHLSSTLSPGDLAITLRNLVLGVALLVTFALPAVLVSYSRRVAGGAQAAWFVVTLLLSWPAYTLFLFLTRHRQAAGGDERRPEDAQAHWG